MSIELWFLPSLFALVVWGVAAFTPKLVVSGLPSYQVMIYQAFGLVLYIPLILAYQGFSIAFDIRGALFGFLAGVFGMVGWLCYLTALKRGPVSVVSILAALYPALTMLLAFVLLKEKVSVLQGAGLSLSIAALLLLVSQKSGDTKINGTGWVPPALAATFFWAGWAFLPKLALATLPTGSVLIYESLGNCAVALVLYAALGFKLQKSRNALLFATLPSFVSMGAATCYMYALSHGPLSIISVLTALYPVVTAILARVILKEKMTQLQIIACCIAVCAIGLMVL